MLNLINFEQFLLFYFDNKLLFSGFVGYKMFSWNRAKLAVKQKKKNKKN